MEHDSQKGRRSHERVQLSLPVQGKCLFKPLKGHCFKGNIKNLSYNGFCLETADRNGFNPGQRLKFKTQLYDGDFSIRGKGFVCWVHSPTVKEPSIHLGVKIVHMRRYGSWCERIDNRLMATRAS